MSRFKIHGIDHLVLRVRNLGASRKLYEGLLGCVMERELPDLGLYQLRAGRQLIDLVPVGGKLAGNFEVVQENKNLDHFCLTVSPFEPEAIAKRMVLAGVVCSEVGSRYGADGYGLSIYIVDPDGNTVELKAAR
jgi:catechol 2,3-dioxygenase-like lactoylglutathione lyase family enzyme